MKYFVYQAGKFEDFTMLQTLGGDTIRVHGTVMDDFDGFMTLIVNPKLEGEGVEATIFYKDENVGSKVLLTSICPLLPEEVLYLGEMLEV